VLAAVLAGAGFLRFYGIDWSLPHLYEEATPLRRAWEMWGFGAGGAFTLNPHFFNYPSLFLYVQLAGQAALYAFWWVTGTIAGPADFRDAYLFDPAPFYVVGRSLTALFGLATVWMVFRIGTGVRGLFAGAAAALVLALSPLHAAKSQYIEVDVPLAFFTTLALGAGVRITRSATRGNFLLAGAALGLAVSTKYTGAVLVAPLTVALVVAAVDGRRVPWRGALWIAGAAILCFSLTSPFVLLDFPTFSKDLAFERLHMRLGHFGQTGATSWAYYAGGLWGLMLSPAVVVAGLGGLIVLGGVRRERWAIVIGSFVVAYAALTGSWSMKADRYMLPLVPAAILLAAGFAGYLVQGLRTRRGRTVAAATTLILLAGPSAARLNDHFRRFHPDTRTLACDFIEATIPAGALLVAEAYGPDLLTPLEYWPLEPHLRARKAERSPLFAQVRIPMFQIRPELTGPFYDLELYASADYFVVNSTVRDRYLLDEERFPRQNAFYRALERGYPLVQRFEAGGRPGPVISIYKNPVYSVPFGSRGIVRPPVRLRGYQQVTGEEAFFYYSLGLSYETFAFNEDAFEAYRLGLQYPWSRAGVHRNLTLGAVRCSLAARRYEEALDVLERSKERCRSPEEFAAFENLQADIRERRMDREEREEGPETSKAGAIRPGPDERK